MNRHARRLVAIWVVLGILQAGGQVSRGQDPVAPLNGLKAQIYAGRNFQRLVRERIDPNIECFWDHGAPADEAPVDDFSVRWSGWIRVPKAGRYKLLVSCDDGVRLWVGGRQLLNEGGTGAFNLETSVELTDTPQSITVEHFDVGGASWIVLLWQPVGVPVPCPVPPAALFPDEARANAKPDRGDESKSGLIAEYFDKSFSRRLRASTVPRAEAIWGEGAPEWGLPPNAGARYTGVLVPPVTGNYKFIGWADNRMRVWIDGKPLLDADFERRKHETAFLDLEANVPYPLRIEFVDTVYGGSYLLHWVPPKGDKELCIPPECLFQTKSAIPKRRPPSGPSAAKGE